MVTKKELKKIGIGSMEEYYEGILEHKNDGETLRSWYMFDKMTDDQKEYFFEYIEKAHYHDDGLSYEMRNLRHFYLTQPPITHQMGEITDTTYEH